MYSWMSIDLVFQILTNFDTFLILMQSEWVILVFNTLSSLWELCTIGHEGAHCGFLRCCCFIIHDQNFSLPIIIDLVCGLRPREVFSIIFIFIPTVFSVKSVPFQLLCSKNCLAHKVVCLGVGLSWTLLCPGSWPVACYYMVSKPGIFFF